MGMNWKTTELGKTQPYELFIFSQTLGIFLTSLACLGIYVAMLKFIPPDPITGKVLGMVKPKQLQKVAPPLPAMLAGGLWTLGFFFSLDGVALLGMGIGYVLTAVGPVAVSGIIATLVFKEVHGTRHQAYFWCSIAMQAIAQGILISQ